MPDQRTLNIALLVCGACALWLLLSPSAFERRARARLAQQLSTRFHTEWEYNVVLTRYRHGLENNPALIEREARKLGYGRPGEHPYPLSEEELRAGGARLAPAAPRHRRDLSRGIILAVAPALLLILAGVGAVLFFANLQIHDPAEEQSHCRSTGSH